MDVAREAAVVHSTVSQGYRYRFLRFATDRLASYDIRMDTCHEKTKIRLVNFNIPISPAAEAVVMTTMPARCFKNKVEKYNMACPSALRNVPF